MTATISMVKERYRCFLIHYTTILSDMKMESWFLLLDVILRDMHKRSGYTFILCLLLALKQRNLKIFEVTVINPVFQFCYHCQCIIENNND